MEFVFVKIEISDSIFSIVKLRYFCLSAYLYQTQTISIYYFERILINSIYYDLVEYTYK